MNTTYSKYGENTIIIREMIRRDWTKVRAIYSEGIFTGRAAFVTQIPNWAKWHAEHLSIGRLVATSNGDKIHGWCALNTVPDN